MIRNDTVFRPGTLALGSRVKMQDGREGTVTQIIGANRYVITGESWGHRVARLGTYRASELLRP